MKTKLIVNQDNQYAIDRFSHAATIQTVGVNQTVVAFYTGPQECHPQQRVELLFNNEGNITESIPLENLSGNPILFEANDQLFIIYSKFEKFPARRAHWWQWCSIWQRKIAFKTGKLYLSEPKQIIIEEPPIQNIRTDMEAMLNHSINPDEMYRTPEGLGYVPRCKPLEINGEFLLPLYREHAPLYHPIILHSTDGVKWTYQGRMGISEEKVGIQPCLWASKAEESIKIHTLMRNFGRIAKVPNWEPRALYAESKDFGKTWTPLEYSLSYLNYNNSIATCSRGLDHKPWIVWNDSKMGRDHMALGYNGRKLIDLDIRYGSYPDISSDGENLHIVYTSEANSYRTPGVRTVIKHKQFSLKSLEKAAMSIDQNLW